LISNDGNIDIFLRTAARQKKQTFVVSAALIFSGSHQTVAVVITTVRQRRKTPTRPSPRYPPLRCAAVVMR
jgi:hypothetical protein